MRLGEVDRALLTPHVTPDVILLLAELLENGTSFSPPHTEVEVDAHSVGDGGVVVRIVDHGLGMTAEQLTRRTGGWSRGSGWTWPDRRARAVRGRAAGPPARDRGAAGADAGDRVTAEVRIPAVPWSAPTGRSEVREPAAAPSSAPVLAPPPPADGDGDRPSAAGGTRPALRAADGPARSVRTLRRTRVLRAARRARRRLLRAAGTRLLRVRTGPGPGSRAWRPDRGGAGRRVAAAVADEPGRRWPRSSRTTRDRRCGAACPGSVPLPRGRPLGTARPPRPTRPDRCRRRCLGVRGPRGCARIGSPGRPLGIGLRRGCVRICRPG